MFGNVIGQIYRVEMEAIPPNAPLPRCKEVDLCMFISINNAGDKLTRKSWTRFMIYIINLLILKKSVYHRDISVFGAESVVMKVGVDTLHAI